MSNLKLEIRNRNGKASLLEARLSELHLPAITHATLLLVQEKLEQERQQQGPRFN
jgi:hypothetical protein